MKIVSGILKCTAARSTPGTFGIGGCGFGDVVFCVKEEFKPKQSICLKEVTFKKENTPKKSLKMLLQSTLNLFFTQTHLPLFWKMSKQYLQV